MDETYAEDSFVVGSEVEEVESSEQEDEDIELMPEDSYVDGRRQYATRRRVFLHKVRAKSRPEAPPEQRAEVKAKRTRVMRIDDSSEEEEDKGDQKRGLAVPSQPKVAREEPSRPQQQQQQQGAVSSSTSSTFASKVSMLIKAQRSSVTEEQQNER